MPYSQKQIDRLIGDGDSRVIPRNAPLTLAQRVSESEVRRRIYSYEDAAAREVLKRFKQAWADIRDTSNRLADYGSIMGKLKPGDAASFEWKRRLAFFTDERLRKLLSDCANLTVNRLNTAYHAGYFGRAWSIDVSTKPDVHVSYSQQSQQRIDSDFTRSWYKRTGESFFGSFELIATKYSQKSRQALNTALVNGETVPEANARLKALLGVQTLKEAFWFTQSNTRTAILSAANLGALALYQENVKVTEAVGGIGIGAVFISAGDGRVCSICRQYAGRIFRIDSLLGATIAAMIEPPVHFGCRCGMVFVVAPEDLLPDDMPPGMTWQEWLVLSGLDYLLGDFMDDGLQSTQVGDEVTYADI